MRNRSTRTLIALAASWLTLAAEGLAAQPIENWPIAASTWTPEVRERHREVEGMELVTAEALPTEPLPFTGISPAGWWIPAGATCPPATAPRR